ncbi:MAG: ATP-binding protein [Veillonella sp.]
MKLIQRQGYLDFLRRNRERPIIKVVSGIRRCGKSTLFRLFKDELLADNVKPEQIISINFEELEYEHLRDYHALYQYILERMQPNETNYIFLDEIQHVDQFHRVVDSLFVKENTDLYITGSNAYFMSSDIATLLTGRYVEIQIAVSFSEFHSKWGNQYSLIPAYEAYLCESSFPYTQQLGGEDFDIQEYLRGLYNTLLLHDVVARLKINDVTILQDIVRYIMANVGSLLSPNKIANSLVSAGRKIDNKTVERYLQGLQDSLLLYKVNRYDVRGKELLRINAKYYSVDVTLRNLLVGNASRDTGHILENIVFLELIRRGYTVYVGQLAKGEIDFVAQKGGITEYYQVSETVLDSNTLNRELAPLEAVQDQYSKFLLTLDELNKNANYDGIQQRNVLEWLLESL